MHRRRNRPSRELEQEAAREPVTISDIVVGETYFALRHHDAVPHAKAIAAPTAEIRATGAARQVLDAVPELVEHSVSAARRLIAQGASGSYLPA